LEDHAIPTVEQARQWYAPDDPVHGFDHVLRLLKLAERLCALEGADLEIVRAAVLFHDAQGELPDAASKPGPARHDHHLYSADFAGVVLERADWSAERIAAVQHCILAHRFRDAGVRPQTREAMVLFDADKLDAIGAVGAARAIAYAARQGQPFYAKPTPGFLVSGRVQPGEPHSAYHEYLFKLIKIKDRLFTDTARALAQERQQRMIDFFAALAVESEG